MGCGEHVDSNERHIVIQEGFWVPTSKCGTNRATTTCLIYPVRPCSLPRSVPDLPAHGDELGHSC